MDGRSIAVEHGDSRLVAIGTLLIGTTSMFSNRSHDAEVTLKAAYTASLAEGDRRNAAFAAVSLSPVFWARRELAEAARWTRDGLTLAQAVSEWRCVGLGLTNMTYLAEFSGLHATAARFYGAMRGDFESFYRANASRRTALR